MVIAPANIYGIDLKIKLIQDYIYEVICDIWDGEVKIYGRGVVLERNGNKTLEFSVDGKNYTAGMVNDKSTGQIGFNVLSRSIENGKMLATADIIFTIDVLKAYKSKAYQDERALMDAFKIIMKSGYVDSITAVKIGVDAVFAGFEVEKLKHRDMSPFHIFSFTTTFEYFAELC